VRAGLVSDHLRAITPVEVNEEILVNYLASSGFDTARIERVEPTLEDIFLTLAGKDMVGKQDISG